MMMLITAGAYSDYGVIALVNWLRHDLTMKQALELYLTERPEQREEYYFDDNGFVAWLNRGGYIEDVDAQEVHIGSYRCAEIRVKSLSRADVAPMGSTAD